MPTKTTKPTQEKKITEKALQVYDLKGVAVSQVEVQEAISNAKASPRLLAQYVRTFLAGKRQGTHDSQTRSEVTGTTKKMYRQKGTGRARHGSGKEPNFVGGGAAFGPKPRTYSLSMNEKQKHRAFLSALSIRIKNNDVICIEGLEKVKKTKDMQNALDVLKVTDKKNILLVVPSKRNDDLFLASRNLKHVSLFNVSALNAYEVLNAKKIIIAKEAFNEIKV